jgi:hypothetical protein
LNTDFRSSSNRHSIPLFYSLKLLSRPLSALISVLVSI